MWLGKFLDLEEDIKELRSKIQKDLFQGIKQYKLTPLEFTILETVFNCRELAGYDLILNLNIILNLWVIFLLNCPLFIFNLIRRK